MARKVGIIQSCNIGDLIIALPIAQHFLNAGDEVHWPIDQTQVAAFSYAEPRVDFIAIARDDPGFIYDTPLRLLQAAGCAPILSLPASIQDHKIANESLARSLKFDEYKFAVAGVPFGRKWALQLRRNREREQALYDRLQLREPYICVHKKGSIYELKLDLQPAFTQGRQVVEIEPLTDNVFDWLTVIERASQLVMLDSCFANLVEQLNLANPKIFVLRSGVYATPVIKNDWKFASLE